MPTFDPFAEAEAARKAQVLRELSGPASTGLTCERCGREIVMLSPASDAPKCRGCGFPGELCRCEPPGEGRLPWYRTHPLIGDQPDEGATDQ